MIPRRRAAAVCRTIHPRRLPGVCGDGLFQVAALPGELPVCDVHDRSGLGCCRLPRPRGQPHLRSQRPGQVLVDPVARERVLVASAIARAGRQMRRHVADVLIPVVPSSLRETTSFAESSLKMVPDHPDGSGQSRCRVSSGGLPNFGLPLVLSHCADNLARRALFPSEPPRLRPHDDACVLLAWTFFEELLEAGSLGSAAAADPSSTRPGTYTRYLPRRLPGWSAAHPLCPRPWSPGPAPTGRL